MARTRNILLVKLLRTDDDQAPTILSSVPLGACGEVVRMLSDFNTYPDGGTSPENYGLLYGPGFILQLPMVGPKDPVNQLAVSMQEEDIAWPVLTRMCRRLGWQMMDPASGRTFGG